MTDRSNIKGQIKASTDPEGLQEPFAKQVGAAIGSLFPSPPDISEKLDRIAFLLERIAEHLGAL